MSRLPTLKPGDSVEIIAPASRCSDNQLIQLKELLTSWGLSCIVADDIFKTSDLPFLANTDEYRFNALKKAIERPETKAIICARGGYGSMRLTPRFNEIIPPATPKLLIGMSDITALLLYFQQEWKWPAMHGTLNTDKCSPESIAAIKDIVFGTKDHITFQGKPLNAAARQNTSFASSITGGNVCLVQASIGTLWQMQGKDRIIFLEEVGERGYRLDRMLEQCQQANLFKDATAIVFGDFLECNEPDGSSLMQNVLTHFAKQCAIPVIHIQGIGHGFVNFPLLFGTSAALQCGTDITLMCHR